MRLILSLCISTLSLVGFAQSSIDVLHYKYSITLNDATDVIYGKAEITIRKQKNLAAFNFDLVNAGNNGKGMTVDSFKYTPQSSSTHTGDKLIIRTGRSDATQAYDTSVVTIQYHGIPADGLIISKNKYGNRTFFADNWPNRGHNWLPCNDVPWDKASVEFIVTAPRHYQVVANGIQVEETDLPNSTKLTHWREDVPISTKVMVIGVADFAVQLSGTINGCIPVYSWVYPENKDKGFYDYAQAKEILPFFINRVGPYGYKKLANVQSKTTFGGLENANTIFYSEGSVSGTRRSESLIAHEIAHQWFGNMATEKTFGHLWLSEGFATYMTILYMENKYGGDTALHMIKQDREEVIAFAMTSKRPVVDTAETDYLELLNANSYQKGGWVLHMLRRELGDSIFWRSIRNYYATYAGGVAGTDDLRRVFENVSGKNLEQFFRQWLYKPGIPHLAVNWKYLEKEQKIEVTVEQLQPELFQFPLEIGIVSKQSQVSRLNITQKKETFTISVTGEPSGITLDPLVSLLFAGNIKRMR